MVALMIFNIIFIILIFLGAIFGYKFLKTRLDSLRNPSLPDNQQVPQIRLFGGILKTMKILFPLVGVIFIIALVVELIATWQQKPGDQSSTFNDNVSLSPEESPLVTDNSQVKYDRDTNADGIPDFIEKNTQYDWQNDECLEKIKGCLAPEIKEGQAKPKNIVIIFDSSGSMAEVVSGSTKILGAKNALKKFIPTIPNDVSLALVVYGHKGNNSASGKAVSCAGVETLYPLGPVDRNSLISVVDGFQPTGWTPLATAISLAKDILSNNKNDNNQVILLTDGQETCEGDPIAAARTLREVNAKTVVDVIALAVSSNDRLQLQRISQAGGGKYTDVNSESEIDQIFKESSNRLNTIFYQHCAVSQINDYGSCLVARLNAALGYLNFTLLPKLKYGSDEYTFLRTFATQMTNKVMRQKDEKYKQLNEFLKSNPVP